MYEAKKSVSCVTKEKSKKISVRTVVIFIIMIMITIEKYDDKQKVKVDDKQKVKVDQNSIISFQK